MMTSMTTKSGKHRIILTATLNYWEVIEKRTNLICRTRTVLKRTAWSLDIFNDGTEEKDEEREEITETKRVDLFFEDQNDELEQVQTCAKRS